RSQPFSRRAVGGSPAGFACLPAARFWPSGRPCGDGGCVSAHRFLLFAPRLRAARARRAGSAPGLPRRPSQASFVARQWRTRRRKPLALFTGHVARLGVGTIPHADMAALSGLEALSRVVAGEYPAPRIAERMNFALVEVGEGRAVFKGVPGVQHLNPLGGIHGGWAATVMDSALGCCVHTLLKAGEAYSTAEMKINYTRPITPDTGEVTCEGKVVH